MTEETQVRNAENEPCDACGCSAEVGFIIKEGDETAEVSLYGESKAQLENEFEKYASLARSVNENVELNISTLTEDSKELHASIKFEVSAEKLIFELKSRSISR